MASNHSPVRRRWLMLFRIGLVIVLVVCINLFSRWLGHQLEIEVRPSNDHMIQGIIIISLIVYTVLLAIPFVPPRNSFRLSCGTATWPSPSH